MCLLFMAILFAGVAPDVMKQNGLHWTKNPPEQSAPSAAGAANKNE
jgi:hypothetical protein